MQTPGLEARATGKKGGAARELIVLAKSERGRRVVASSCAQAEALGVHAGMTLAHAQGLIGSRRAHIVEDEPARDLLLLEALARWAMRYSPKVAPDPPDGLILDATGCERLYGGAGGEAGAGIDRMLREVVAGLGRLGVQAQGAGAPTLGAAWGLARWAPGGVVAEGELASAVRRLPAAALRVEQRVVDDLGAVGIDRVEQLLEVSREQIAGRFGEGVLLRIDQALGSAMEPVRWLRPQETIEASARFAGPVQSLEVVEGAVRSLAMELAGKLRARSQGVREVRLGVESLDAELKVRVRERALRFSRPTRDGEHLWKLLRPHVERLDMGRGVEGLELRAVRARLLADEQKEWEGSRVGGRGSRSEIADLKFQKLDSEAAQLIDLLQSRLGHGGVLRIELVDTHVPEGAWRGRPADERPAKREATGRLFAERPTVLFDAPERAQVTLMHPEGPVMVVRWRGERRIVRSIGPERIGRRWWQFEPAEVEHARDYYRVRDEGGRWLWIYRNLASGGWYVQGVWG